MDLPPATASPCNECPWRRDSARGWLGPHTPEKWAEMIHSDIAIACHKTIKTSMSWDGALQCAGAAIMRANICKSPRDPQVAVTQADRTSVFASTAEFIDHHRRTP